MCASWHIFFRDDKKSLSYKCWICFCTLMIWLNLSKSHTHTHTFNNLINATISEQIQQIGSWITIHINSYDSDYGTHVFCKFNLNDAYRFVWLFFISLILWKIPGISHFHLESNEIESFACWLNYLETIKMVSRNWCITCISVYDRMNLLWDCKLQNIRHVSIVHR